MRVANQMAHNHSTIQSVKLCMVTAAWSNRESQKDYTVCVHGLKWEPIRKGGLRPVTTQQKRPSPCEKEWEAEQKPRGNIRKKSLHVISHHFINQSAFLTETSSSFQSLSISLGKIDFQSHIVLKSWCHPWLMSPFDPGSHLANTLVTSGHHAVLNSQCL